MFRQLVVRYCSYPAYFDSNKRYVYEVLAHPVYSVTTVMQS